MIPTRIQLVAKIEKDTALLHLASILDATDAVMVARGDLGVELPFEEVPLVQKRLIREANLRGKPVITATQMLESMVKAPRPTRAEASDVANAILDGTDAVMLSAETAVGDYALEAVQAMDRIAREVESHRTGRSAAFDLAVGRRSGGGGDRFAARDARTEDAIAVAVCAASELLDTRVIVCFTSSGFTARTVASFRPSVPIVAVTPEPETYRAARAGLGGDPGPGRSRPRLRRDDPRGARGAPRAGAGARGRPGRGHRRRALRHARHHQPPQDRDSVAGCASPSSAPAPRSACRRSAAAARSAAPTTRGTAAPAPARSSRRGTRRS